MSVAGAAAAVQLVEDKVEEIERAVMKELPTELTDDPLLARLRSWKPTH